MKQSLAVISILTILSSITNAIPHPPSQHQDQQGQQQEAQPSSTSLQLDNTATTTTSVVPDDNATDVPDGSSHASGGEEYVVVFDTTNPEVADILAKLDLTAEHDDVRYTFNNTAFHGFAASMKTHCIDLLNEMPDVATVEKNVRVTTNQGRGKGGKGGDRGRAGVRNGSPWGLERISTFSSPAGESGADESDMDFTYAFADEKLGQGVDIYVVDTGVEIEHAVFGGRARQGFAFDRNNAADEDGHGTHCAGTAAGSTFGVASGANVIAVKVLGADGSGVSSDTLAGMDWIIEQHQSRKNDPGFVGSIMSMSWGLDDNSASISRAVKAATDAGVHVSVAAGNSAIDSCTVSPASAGGENGPAVTVGSIDIKNRVSSFSNTGPCNDVYAPGESILSSWKDSPNSINVLSGTSMACPHVTGVMAYLMVQDPDLAASPERMKSFLRETALEGVLKKGKGKVVAGDPMLLVTNGMTQVGASGTSVEGKGTGKVESLKKGTRRLLRLVKRQIVGQPAVTLRY